MASTYARTNSQLLRELGRSVTKSIIKGFAGFKGAITTAVIVSDAIERGFETLSNYQSRALAVNQTITEFLNQNMTVLKGLPGGIMSAADEALTAKMEGIPLTKGYLRLAQQLKYSGQSNESLLATMVLLRSSTTLTQESLSELSDNIIKYGVKGQVSQDKLLKALAGLEENLTLFDMHGFSKPLLDSVAGLTSVLGPEFNQTLPKFINQLFGGFDSMRIAMALGFDQQVQAIEQGQNVSQNLKDIAKIITKNFSSTFGGARTNLSKELQENFGGDFIRSAYALSNRFDQVGDNLEQELENTRRNENLLNKITNSYEAFKDTFISPLTLTLLEAGSNLLDFAVKHADAVRAFAYAVAGFTLGKSIALIGKASMYNAKILGIELARYGKAIAFQFSKLTTIFSFAGLLRFGKLLLLTVGRFLGPIGIIAGLAYAIYTYIRKKKESEKDLKDIANSTKEQADKIRADRFKDSVQTIPSYAKETNESISEALMNIIRFSELRLQASNKLSERMANATEKTARGIEQMNQNRGFKNPIPGMGLSR